jgi:hypothetical protein
VREVLAATKMQPPLIANRIARPLSPQRCWTSASTAIKPTQGGVVTPCSSNNRTQA